MIDENNPYQSPTSVFQALSTPATSGVLVRRGRILYLGIVAFTIALECLLALFGAKPEPVRIALTAGLLFAAWRGHGWAVVLLGLGFGLGILLLIAVLPAIVSTGSPLASAMVLLVGVAYAAIVLGLIFSQSLHAFFKHQAQQRQRETPAAVMTDNRRNVVTLTPDAVALAQKIIADRGFSPETALRVVIRKGGSQQPDIEYDLPLDDERDWVGESSGLAVLVGKAIAEELEGLTIDARNGQYLFLSR